MDYNQSKQEPWLELSMKSEPALLVKEEILEDGSQAGNEQQCVQGTTTPAGTDEDCSTSLSDVLNVKHELSDVLNVKQEPSDWLNVKQEPSVLLNVKREPSDLLNVSDVKTEEDIDIRPTVHQQMDIHYKINKNMSAGTGDNTIVDGGSESMPCSGVKKESHEDKLRGSLTPQKATMNEGRNARSTLQSLQLTTQLHQLESICRVQLTRLDTFQCEVCDTVYAEKRRLVQHLQSVHGSRPRTSLFVNFRQTDKQQCATASRIYSGQKMTEDHYDEAHMKSCLRQQMNLQQHRLCQQHKTRSNSFKCNKTIRKPHLLSTHNKVYQGNNRKNSMMTSSVIAASSNQNRNEMVKRKQKPKVCDKGYSSKSTKLYMRVRNRNIHRGEKRHRCDTCDARFARSGALTRHMRVHTGEKPYQCDTCDKRFAESGALTRHMRVHTGEKPYQCTMCDARFAHSDSLTYHMTIHTGEKSYQCTTCDARFSQRSGLNKHMRVHTGDKPYQCTTCDARFSHYGSLTNHRRVHTGEKPYQCTTCDARFVYSSGLTTHKRVHKGEKPCAVNARLSL